MRGTLAELGLDPGLCDSELAACTVVTVLTEWGVSEDSNEKGSPEKFLTFQKAQ